MRMTQEQYEALTGDRSRFIPAQQRQPPREESTPAPQKKSKFRNIRCKATDGRGFGSRLERDYYEELRMRHFAGDVLWFVCQPQLILEGGVIYRCDFLVQPRVGTPEWIDTKGYQTQDSKNKLKQVKDRYGIDVILARKR